MEDITFPFSDTIAGYVVLLDRATQSFRLRTSGGREHAVQLRPNTYAFLIRNFGEPYVDCTAQAHDLLTPDRYLFTYGTFYPEKGRHTFEAQFLVFVGREPGECVFECSNWWIRQIRSLGDFYLKAQFGSKPVDYANYRTTIKLTGEKPADNYRQETDTISRLVYGFATAYLLTGDDRYVEGAEKGTEYLREHMRFYEEQEKVVFWYHGIDIKGEREEKVFASENDEDILAFPAYEQIYALAGPVQTYRITGDPRILRDAELTVDLFDRFYHDNNEGGYFSHLDPMTLKPHVESLGANRGARIGTRLGTTLLPT